MPAKTIKAECAWGEGPDVLVCGKGRNILSLVDMDKTIRQPTSSMALRTTGNWL